MGYTNLPFLYEGEVIAVQKSPYAKKQNAVRYTVNVTMPNGSEIVCPNAVEASMFGGIDDYFQQRARTSRDVGNKYEYSGIDAINDARIGQRCYIQFIGGSLSAPVITSWQQHPNQTQEFENPEELDPQAVLKYLGNRFDFMDDGAFRITHFGLPKIKFVDGNTAIIPPTEIPSVGALSDEAPNPIEADKKNIAVEPADAAMRTLMEFKATGGWKITDSLSQIVDIDTENKRIVIANNWQDTLDPEATEFVSLDRPDQMVYMSARKLIKVESLGNREDKTAKDHIHTIGGNEELTVTGDQDVTIEGGLTIAVTKDHNETVKGTYTVEVKGAASFTYDDDLDVDSQTMIALTAGQKIIASAEAGGTLSLNGAKVALGANGTEVLKTLSDTIQGLIDTLTAIMSLTVGTTFGPSSPPINLPDFAKVLTTLTTLKGKLDLITGSI